MQTVSQAKVSVDGVVVSQVDRALLIYLGISEADTEELLEKFCWKVTNLRIFPDESDRATHEEGFTLELKTRERERRLLNKIDSAVESIDQNDYGL